MRLTPGSFVLGAAFGAVTVWAGLTFGSVMAAQSPGSAAKYTSKVVLENDRVRVRDVTFPPGVLDTGMHRHDVPHVGIIVTAGALTFTEGGKPGETVKYEPGSVGFREANVTHQVANPGGTPMRVIEVELK
jgi:quercetin dioxygenase-like cupin family protein